MLFRMHRRRLLTAGLSLPIAAPLVLALGACGGGGSDEPVVSARLTVRAEDRFGLPVPGVRLELRSEDLSVVLRTDLTGTDGTLRIKFTDDDLDLPGDFSLTIVPAPGYALAPGQASVVRISVRADEGLTVVIVLIEL
jgi:hypothetical protein